MRLSCVGSRCATITKAMPPSAGRAPKSLVSAPRPPADEPTPTIGGASRVGGLRRRVAWALLAGGAARRALLAGLSPVVFLDRVMAGTPTMPHHGSAAISQADGREREALEDDERRAPPAPSSACFAMPGARPLVDAASRSPAGTGNGRGGRRLVRPRSTRIHPRPETGAHVCRVQPDRVTDCDEGTEPPAVVGGEPRLDIGEQRTTVRSVAMTLR